MRKKEWRMRDLSVIGVLAICLGHGTSIANTPSTQLDGDQFSSACTRPDEAWVSFCNGYVQAVVDSLREGDGVCLPADVTRAEVIAAVESKITGSKELRSMNAYDAFKLALRRSYACA